MVLNHNRNQARRADVKLPEIRAQPLICFYDEQKRKGILATIQAMKIIAL